MTKTPFLTISLDFELFWGLRDVSTISSYGGNILGVREAIPAILKLFLTNGIHATWAVVGLASFQTRKELLDFLPEERPGYIDRKLDPYSDLSSIGNNEQEDPYHYGYSLVRMIQDTPGMEIGSHSFSHFYCLEPRLNPFAFRADLQASIAAMQRLDIQPKSLVFCRNQYDATHLRDAVKCGFVAFRGNEDGFFYVPRTVGEETYVRRAGRLTDAYLNFSGSNFCRVYQDAHGMINVPSSRFLRPCGFSMFEQLRLRRILKAIEVAANSASGFHLWWHPHNFGVGLERNLSFLAHILRHFRYVQDRFGMKSLTMSEAAELKKVKQERTQGAYP